MAKGADSIHSPFVFSFYNEVVAFPYNFYCFSEIEKARKDLLTDKSPLEFTDAGAWEKKVKTKVSTHARTSLMPPEKAQLLFRFVHWYQPKNLVELGTSFGITTSYIRKAYPSKILTFEAIPAIAEKAKEVWKKLNLNQIDHQIGKTEDLLPAWLSQAGNIPDLVIVDANHRYEATMANFHLLVEHVPDQGCLVFDDLYWSPGMKKAWDEICQHPRVTVSIDLFYLGFVFFRKENRKQHFVLRW